MNIAAAADEDEEKLDPCPWCKETGSMLYTCARCGQTCCEACGSFGRCFDCDVLFDEIEAEE